MGRKPARKSRNERRLDLLFDKGLTYGTREGTMKERIAWFIAVVAVVLAILSLLVAFGLLEV